MFSYILGCCENVNLLWLLFGHFWSKLGYFLLERLVTLLTSFIRGNICKDDRNKEIFVLRRRQLLRKVCGSHHSV